MGENQTNKPVVQSKPIDMLKTVISADSVQLQFKNALGEHKDTFIASLIDLYTSDSQLQKCQPKLVIAEALRAATLKLPLNKALGFAYIIVFNNSVKDPSTNKWTKVPTPTFVPGYKGYIQLAMRTGQYKTINADVVYEGELRTVDKLSGLIAFDGEKTSDKIVGYFCYFKLINGFEKTLYINVEDMAKYALRYSPSFKGKEKLPTVDELVKLAQSQVVSSKVGWEGNFNDMAIKTVIRKLLSKYGYLSVEMMNVIEHDEDEAASDRNYLIEENANSMEISEDVQFEDVDKETGEIKDNGKKEPDWA